VQWRAVYFVNLWPEPRSSAAAKVLETLSPALVIDDRFYTEEKYGGARVSFGRRLCRRSTRATILAKTFSAKWRLCTEPMFAWWFQGVKPNG
jgi:hypothetical protein